MFQKNKLVIYVFVALIATTFLIRLSGLTFSPPGFFCDETSIGYNAYSILETGKDEKGIAFPVFFKAFGDYKNPVYIYLATVPIKLFGLDVFSVRLTSAILGIGSILLFIYFLYLLKKANSNCHPRANGARPGDPERIFLDSGFPCQTTGQAPAGMTTGAGITTNILDDPLVFALAGGLIMSLMPWHFQFSRIAFEAISLVFFITLDMALFALYLKTKKPIYYLLFGLSMVISLFAYSIGRLVVPLSAVLVAIIWRKELFGITNILPLKFVSFIKRVSLVSFLCGAPACAELRRAGRLHPTQKKKSPELASANKKVSLLNKNVRINVLISILSISLLALILLYDHYIDPAGILSRPHNVLIIDDNPPIYVIFERFISNYFSHFSPEFLFHRGDLNYRHSPGVSSMLFTSFFLPLIVGLVYCIGRFKKRKLAAFLVLQFFLFPFPASVTVIDEGAQATRAIHIVPFLALLITFGAFKIFDIFWNDKKRKYILVALLVFAALESAMFYKYYFTAYPISSIRNFEGGMPEAMRFAFAQKASYYYISTSVCKYRIEIPFFMKYPPEKFQQSLIFPNARCLDARRITNPKPGSIAVYKINDPIAHFPNEKLLKTVSYTQKTVTQEAGTQRELYENKEIELYYVYKY